MKIGGQQELYFIIFSLKAIVVAETYLHLLRLIDVKVHRSVCVFFNWTGLTWSGHFSSALNTGQKHHNIFFSM